jgi:hypothetical protein
MALECGANAGLWCAGNDFLAYDIGTGMNNVFTNQIEILDFGKSSNEVTPRKIELGSEYYVRWIDCEPILTVCVDDATYSNEKTRLLTFDLNAKPKPKFKESGVYADLKCGKEHKTNDLGINRLSLQPEDVSGNTTTQIHVLTLKKTKDECEEYRLKIEEKVLHYASENDSEFTSETKAFFEVMDQKGKVKKSLEIYKNLYSVPID